MTTATMTAAEQILSRLNEAHTLIRKAYGIDAGISVWTHGATEEQAAKLAENVAQAANEGVERLYPSGTYAVTGGRIHVYGVFVKEVEA